MSYPDLVTKAQAIYDRRVAAVEQYLSAVAETANAFASLTGERYGWDDHQKANHLLEDPANAMISVLVTHATKAFSQNGIAPEIPTDIVKKTFTDWDNDFRKIKTTEVWDHLDREYNKKSTIDAVIRTAASNIIRYFNLEDSNQKVVKGRVVMSVHTYLCDISLKWSNKKQLHYSSAEQLRELLDALMIFAKEAEDYKLVYAINDIARMVLSFTQMREIVSREVIFSSDVVMVRTLQSKWEFHFSKETANNIRLFISKNHRKSA